MTTPGPAQQQMPPVGPPPGSFTPGYTYPQPQPKKRRRWPWIVGGILVLLFVIGIAGGSDPAPATGSGPGAPAAPAAPAAAPETVEVAFGTPYSWDNEEILISEPRQHTEDNLFLQPEGRYVAFDVTVRNIGDRDRDVLGTEITVVHAGRAAQEAFIAGSDAFPQGRIPPGGEVTFTQVYDVGTEPGEVRVSVRPDLFAGTTAYFVGQF